MRKLLMMIIVLLMGVNCFAAYTWVWETGTNPDLLNQFMTNPNFGNMGMDTITLKNGLTIDNATNNALEFNENSEELILTFADTAVTWSTSTGIVTMGFGVIVPTANQFLFTPRAAAVGLVEGTIYYDSDDDKLYLRNASTWVDLTATTTSTFDDIYNNSAAALGVTVDVNPVIWTAPNANDKVVMSFVQADTGTTKAITITNAGTGNTIDIEGQAAGKDIEGTGDTWNVTGAGAATFVSGAIPTLTSTTVTLSNGATITNATDTEIKFTETATALEDFSIDFLADEIDLKSGSGVATIGWGDLDSWTGLSVLTFDSAASTITLPATGAGQDLTVSVTGTQDASLILSSTGTAEDALTISTTSGGINITNASGTAGEDIDVTSAASINLTASEAATDAIVISAGTALGGIDITSNEDIDITTTGASGEDISLTNTGGSINITATEEAANAIAISASGTAGGITTGFGTGNMVVTGTGVSADFLLDADLISIDGTGTSNFTVTSNAGSEDFTIALAGATDSHLVLSSTGTSINAAQITASAGGVLVTGAAAAANAVKLDASDVAGGIGLTYGTGNLIITGAGVSADFTLDGDLFSIDGTGTSNVTVTSNAGSEDFTVALAGATDSHLVLSSTGTSVDAAQLTASAGGIKLNASNAAGNIDMAYGTGNMTIVGTGASADFLLDCDLFSIDGIGTSNVTVTSTADAEDFTVALAGAFNSSLVLSSTGTAADALQLTSSAGGILCSPSGVMADQFKVLAAGTIAGNAINLATTNGGIVLTAGNADNGDMTLTVGDDLAANVTGNTAITTTGTVAMSGSNFNLNTSGELKNYNYYVKHLIASTVLADVNSGQIFYVSKPIAGAPTASDIIITLPAASAGLTFTIIDANETAAADVTITAASGDKIDDGAATGSYVHDTDADDYACVTLVAIDDTDWVVISEKGTWSNE